MEIIALVFGVIGTLSGLLSFLISSIAIKHILDSKSTPVTNINIPPSTQHTDMDVEVDLDSDELSEEYKSAFAAGRDHVWTTVQLALFDMYRNLDILDYDASVDQISNRMDTIIRDDDLRYDIIEAFKQYMEEQDGHSSDDY